MVVGPFGPSMGMMCFICSLVGCYTVSTELRETWQAELREAGQAGQAGDREQLKTGQ